jgi:hypothetical protein
MPYYFAFFLKSFIYIKKPEAGILICSLEIHSEDFELFSVQYVKNLEDSGLLLYCIIFFFTYIFI